MRVATNPHLLLVLTLISLFCIRTTAIRHRGRHFKRISTFLVCSQIELRCNDDTETVAEIVVATPDGLTLVYTDSKNKNIGFVNIRNPFFPRALGTVEIEGEPTSVSIIRNFAVVGVNTNPDFGSGVLLVVDMRLVVTVHDIDVGGQPDSVATSPDGRYIVVSIGKKRDEDIDVNGVKGGLPAGYLVVIDASPIFPQRWPSRIVDLAGLDGLEHPEDPDPKSISINSDNIAVVTLQKNNAIIIVDLSTAMVVNSFTAGVVKELRKIDTQEGDGNLVIQNDTLTNVLREPDGVVWLDSDHFATADEGGFEGGSRGFTIFDTSGHVKFTSGNELEHIAVSLGHYNDGRSENRGNEPENCFVGNFGRQRYLFINSERSSLVFVYSITKNVTMPEYTQALPVGLGPEGGVSIPSRNLVAVASEVDDRNGGVRSSISIYSYTRGEPTYPTLFSGNRNGVPIPWGGLSGLAGNRNMPNLLLAVEDGSFVRSRVFSIDISDYPSKIVRATQITDPNGFLTPFNQASVVNDDKTVNLNMEGISNARGGGYWIVSEGMGGGGGSMMLSPNLLIKITRMGVITDVVTLPDEVNALQSEFGFKGVSEYNRGMNIIVTFGGPIGDESNPRLGIYDIASMTWSFLYYPLSFPTSRKNGSIVKLSDIVSIGEMKFLVLEQDDQGGPDASIKRIYEIDVVGNSSTSMLSEGETVEKHLKMNLLRTLREPAGLVYMDIGGMAVTSEGNVWIVNNNGGADGTNGETQLLNLGKISHSL